MRIKLSFSNSKVCFFVNKKDCHVVSDLAYHIQRRFFSRSGLVSLFLDDFYIPPTENINIIQENDILIVKFEPLKSKSSSESSSEEEDQKPLKKRKKPNTVQSKPIKSPAVASSAKKTFQSNSKKTIPLSQLGITNNGHVTSETESSDSDSSTDTSSSSEESESSSDSDSSSDEEIIKYNKTVKKNQKPVKKATKNTKIATVTIDSSSSSSSSSSSESSSSSDEEPAKKKKKLLSTADSNNNNTTNKVDFHVSGLSVNATSTPGASNSLLKKPRNNSKINTSKDKYKNVSQVFTYTPNTTQSTDITATQNPETSNQTSVQTTTNINDSIADTPNKQMKSILKGSNSMSVLASDEHYNTEPDQKPSTKPLKEAPSIESHVSGKTLRNRRRRQRKIQKARQEKINESTQSEETESKVNNGEGHKKTWRQQKSNILGSVGSLLQNIGSAIVNKKESNGTVMDDETESKINGQKKESGFTNGHHVENGKMDVDVDEEIKIVKIPKKIEPVKRNYNEFELIKECPPVLSVIAFKLFEMSENYQPYVTEYKEARIVSFDHESKMVELKSMPGHIIEGKRRGKFEMSLDDTSNKEEEKREKDAEEEENDKEYEQIVAKKWDELMEQRLIESTS